MTTDATAPDVAGTVFDESAVELAKSYANALLNATKDETDAVLDDLDAIVVDVLQGQPKFAEILGSSSVSELEKDRILTTVFEGRALPTVVNFLRVLNRHGRLGLLTLVVRSARAIHDHKSGRRAVTVRSAVPIDDAQRASLQDRLATLIGATPQMKLEVDPSLIAGLVVQVGDDVYDASVRTRLHRLRDRLIERKSHEIQSRRDYFSYPA
jgi:F-type H+-transporting ATPase subunit delta